MENWYPEKSALTRPVFHSLAEQIGMAIQEGLLEPGERLPPQRDLASDMNVSLQTVSRAYELLRRRGLVQGEIGRGTFVRTQTPHGATPFRTARSGDSVVELSILKPVVGTLQEQMVKKALAALSQDIPDELLFSFRPNEGLLRHRKSGADWLSLCGVPADPDNVLVTNGVTQATTTALLTAGNPGATIVTESISHHSLAALCSCLAMKLKGLDIDRYGILPQAFEKACRQGGVKVLYLMPSLANPTVYLMSEDRRHNLLEIAKKFKVFILENDVLGPLVTNKPATFASLAPEITFYLTSFTKCLIPGLRTGYMTIPPGMLRSARNSLLTTAWMATPLIAEIASRWISDGTARKLLLWQRRALNERYKTAQHVLGKREYFSHPSAPHLWLPLSGRWRSDPFTAQALEQGVAVAPAGPFMINVESDVRAVRVSLGSAEPRELDRGLRVLEQLLDREAEYTLDTF